MTLHSLLATYNDPKAGKAYEDCYSYNDPKFDLVADMYSSTLISPAEAALNSQIADNFCEAPLVPLCAHIFDYFLAAPKTFWVRVTIPELS